MRKYSIELMILLLYDEEMVKYKKDDGCAVWSVILQILCTYFAEDQRFLTSQLLPIKGSAIRIGRSICAAPLCVDIYYAL